MKPMRFSDGTRLTLAEIEKCVEPWDEDTFERYAIATGYSSRQIKKFLRWNSMPMSWWRWFV